MRVRLSMRLCAIVLTALPTAAGMVGSRRRRLRCNMRLYLIQDPQYQPLAGVSNVCVRPGARPTCATPPAVPVDKALEGVIPGPHIGTWGMSRSASRGCRRRSRPVSQRGVELCSLSAEVPLHREIISASGRRSSHDTRGGVEARPDRFVLNAERQCIAIRV
jgi:hypothetical protein